jgi:hypothetical protein
MDTRPTTESIKQRALGIVEECMAYPEAARERLVDIKRGAIEQLMAEPDKNREVIEQHYPGYQPEDLKTLIGFLPRGKSDKWRL